MLYTVTAVCLDVTVYHRGWYIYLYRVIQVYISMIRQKHNTNKMEIV